MCKEEDFSYVEITDEKMEEIKDIIEEYVPTLDVEVYRKQCNFFQGTNKDGELEFYSRDSCTYITLRELLSWYIERLCKSEYKNQAKIMSEYFGDFFRYCAKLALEEYNIG